MTLFHNLAPIHIIREKRQTHPIRDFFLMTIVQFSFLNIMTTNDFLPYASRTRPFEMDVSTRKETLYGCYTYGYAIGIDGRILSVNVHDG